VQSPRGFHTTRRSLFGKEDAKEEESMKRKIALFSVFVGLAMAVLGGAAAAST